MAYSSFDTVPSSATGKPEPFQLHIPDSDLADFKTLLSLSRIGPQTWDNKTSTREAGHDYGLTREWFADAKDTWANKFDWRRHEAHINSFPNFKMAIQDGDGEPLSVHFAALFSRNKDATPVIFMHGWPGCFLEFLPLLGLLRDKYTADTLPFHAIVPSLPGYGLSSELPLDRDFTPTDTARVLNRLMVELGFGAGYVAQGGDVGYFIARIMSVAHDECKALHVNYLPLPPDVDTTDTEGLTARDIGLLESSARFHATGAAYAMENGTRPSTIGLVTSTSPLALLGWIGEKLLEWADTPIPLDTILAMTSLYWFSESMPRCVYPYRHLMLGQGHGPISTTKPLGYSCFKDLGIAPGKWCGPEHFPNLKFRRDHDEGGHFAALEQPKAFLEDVEEFVIKIVGPL